MEAKGVKYYQIRWDKFRNTVAKLTLIQHEDIKEIKRNNAWQKEEFYRECEEFVGFKDKTFDQFLHFFTGHGEQWWDAITKILADERNGAEMFLAYGRANMIRYNKYTLDQKLFMNEQLKSRKGAASFHAIERLFPEKFPKERIAKVVEQPGKEVDDINVRRLQRKLEKLEAELAKKKEECKKAIQRYTVAEEKLAKYEAHAQAFMAISQK